jgi:hypothetical protein
MGCPFEHFNESVAQTTASGCLMPNHWHLVAWPQNDGRLLCASWDDFMVVKLADDVRGAIKKPPC